MFYCPLHNWYSDEAPCPACHKTYTTITTTTSGEPEPETERIEVVTEDNEQWVKLPKAAFEKELMQAFNAAREAIIKDKELQYRYSTVQDYLNKKTNE